MDTLRKPSPRRIPARRDVVGSGENQGDRRQGQQGGLGTGARGVEVLFRVAEPAGDHRGAEHEQDVADDGAGNRGFHHVVQPGAQRGERDDQLRRIAERGIEQPAHAFAGALRQLLRRAPHPSGEGQDGECGSHEDEKVALWRQVFQGDHHRDDDQQPVQHAAFCFSSR